MRYVVLLFFILSCRNVPYTGNAGDDFKLNIECKEGVNVKTVHCFMTFITGGDTGGEWQVNIKPVESTIQTRLIGSNPCIEWSLERCGQYRFWYIVGDACCRDTAIVNINKCCIDANINCN